MSVTNRRTTCIVAGVAFAALLVNLPAAAEARPHKRTVSATIDGKRVKWKGRRLVLFDEIPGGGFTVVATKIRGTRTIGFGCAIVLEGQTFPVTTTVCNANYASRRGCCSAKTWLNTGLDPNNPFQVTFESFDGTVVQGTFIGTLLSTAIGDDSTLSVQGSFRGPLRQRVE